MQQTKSRPRPQHTEREASVSCSAVKIWHTRQLPPPPPLQIGLMRVGFFLTRETTAVLVVLSLHAVTNIFWLKFLGETLRERERESQLSISRDRKTRRKYHHENEQKRASTSLITFLCHFWDITVGKMGNFPDMPLI